LSLAGRMNFVIKLPGESEAQIHSWVGASFERHPGVPTIEQNVDVPTNARNVDAPTIERNVDMPTIARYVDADNCTEDSNAGLNRGKTSYWSDENVCFT
jgi:hypothetical protein